MRRWAFSSTTIASSTTRPIDKHQRQQVSRLIEKPKAHSAMNAAITQTGTVTAGISAARAAAQEQPDHQQHQRDRLGQGVVDLVHRDVDVQRGIVGRCPCSCLAAGCR